MVYVISTLEIHFLFFRNEFREGTYTHCVGEAKIPMTENV
jgi:hypothetical protein